VTDAAGAASSASADSPVYGRRGRWLYPLAMLGAHLAFMPLLVLLLPRRVERLAAGAEIDPGIAVSWLLLAGGIAASIAHIAAGGWSDRWIIRHGNRRGIIGVGLAALIAAYGLLALAPTLALLGGAFVLLQLALNLTFSPLGAVLTDHVPDRAKGRMAGWMNAALPISTLTIGGFAYAFPSDSNAAFALIAAGIAAAILPLLIFWDFGRVAGSARVAPQAERLTSARSSGGKLRGGILRDFAAVWTARFFIQMGAAFAIGYLYVTVSAAIADPRAGAGWPDRTPSILVGQLAMAAAIVAVCAALGSGWISDRLNRRVAPLAMTAAIAAVALALLAAMPGWPLFIAAYALFHFALTGFLSIDTALVAQLLADNPRRGAWLGVMNLTNTLPAILVPSAALAVLARGETLAALGWLFAASAIGAALAALLVMLVRNVR